MLDGLEIFRQAQALARHAGARQDAVARNVANADTPGYRPADLRPFAEAYRSAEGALAPRATRAGHFGAEDTDTLLSSTRGRPVAGASSPNGNGVSLEAEMTKAAEIRHEHELALSIYQNALGILRTSLGRPR